MTDEREPASAADRDRLLREPATVAPDLLGALIVSEITGRVVLRITEVEAYGGVGEDPGSHAHRRQTARNAAMFGPVGHAYVYFTYGMHWCLNVVAHGPGRAGAVLLRAGEVLGGLAVARERRPAARTDRDLARGPARLAAALGVTGAQDGIDLLDPSATLRLELRQPPSAGAAGVACGPRTGIAGEGAPTPWRYWLPHEATVSPHRPARPRRRR